MANQEFDPARPFGLLSTVHPYNFASWHATRAEARQEAETLVNVDPARSYCIVKCVALVRIPRTAAVETTVD